MHLSERTRLILLWLLVGVLAVLSCCLLYPAAHFQNEWLPVGNDAYYHARRILDTAANPGAFYEFDKKIHAPEGSLLTWPWGYDYALGWLTRLVVMAGFSAPPINFLVWVPVGAVFVSVGLMMLIGRRMSLSPWTATLAGLCVALSPLTQNLHGVGQIDHHYAEYIFALATIVLGLKWFSRPEDHATAACLGVLLGVAPAIHNGLFILQLPVLALMALWWFQAIRIPQRAALFFSVALLAATLAVLIPSLPFRMGRFEYYTLSWYHLYVAAGTAVAAYLLSVLPRTKRSVLILGAAAVLFLLPLVHQMLMARQFLGGTLDRLDRIEEMQSPWAMAVRSGGVIRVGVLYSVFIFLWPLTIGLCAYRAWAERTSARLFFWVCAVCGLSLLIMQYRMHYFGSFALVMPWLIVAESLVSRHEPRRKVILLATTLVFLLMYAMPLRYALPGQNMPGGDPDFPALRPVLADLHDACAKEPGVVLADNNAGHHIRYFTDCSVIVNNFLLTKQHMDKMQQFDRLFATSADKLPSVAPYVRYVLVRPSAVWGSKKEGYKYVSYTEQGNPLLIQDLLLKPVEEVSPKYVLLRQVVMRTADPNNPIPYMRLFRIADPPGQDSRLTDANKPGVDLRH